MFHLCRQLVAQVFQRIERPVNLFVGLMVLVDESIAQLVVYSFVNFTLAEIEVTAGFDRESHIIQFADVQSFVACTLCRLVNPVYHVAPPAVEG